MVLQPAFGPSSAVYSSHAWRTNLFHLFRRHWSISTLGRLFLLFLMSCMPVIGSYLGLVPSPVFAASKLQAPPASSINTSHLPSLPGTSVNGQQLRPSGSGNESGVPTLLANHINAVGEQPYYTYMKWHVNDHLVVEVNVGGGNLTVHTSDLHIQGTGLDLTIERFYNVMATDSRVSGLSQHWNLSVGSDVYVHSNSDGSVTYYSPSGTPFTFTPNGSGGYTDPSGLNATLTPPSANSDHNYHLDFHKNHETYEFDSAGHMTVDEDKNGNAILYSLSNGLVTKATDTQGRITTFTYDSFQRLIAITDPTNRTVRYSYDNSGNLASSTDALGQKTTYGYESGSDDLTQITDSAGRIFNITYDPNSPVDEVASVTDGTGAQTTFSYKVNDDDTNTTIVTDARHNQTTYKSDKLLRVTDVTDALNHKQSKSYTPNSDVSSLTDSLGSQTQFQFDSHNNITSVADATGATDTFSYQDNNHPFSPTASKDAQGNSLAYTYDDPGNLQSTKNVTSGSKGDTVTYKYNSNGTLASSTITDDDDSSGQTTHYDYDRKGNLIKVTPPTPSAQKPTTIQRDSLSRAVSVTDGKNQTTNFTYDVLDHITKVTYADGSTVAYTFDQAGNVTRFTDNTGTTSFTYDATNRLLTKTLPSDVTMTMAYDTIGNLTSYSDAGGKVGYTYNAVNLVTTLTEPNGNNTTFGYDSNNQRISVGYPNGATIHLKYDKAGHETEATSRDSSATVVASYSYDYEGTHLRQSMKDNVLNQETDYHYGTTNRLLEADVFNSAGTQVDQFKYKYDKANNLISQTIHLGTSATTYTYDAANELVSSSDGKSYGYDDDGNLTSISSSSGTVTYTYNAKNQTTSINGVSMAYTGVDQNQRITAGGTTFLNSPLGVSSQTDGNGTTYFTRDNRGNLVSERTSSGTYYYLFDGLGSIVGLTNSSGNLINNERYQYAPYGSLLHTPNGAELQANPWRFAAGYYDSGTGLTKFGVRYYDPSLTRWSQQDPVGGSLGDLRSTNRYVYAKCDPVNVTDAGGAFTCGGAKFIYWLTVAGSVLGVAASITAGPFGVISAGLLGEAAILTAGDAMSNACGAGNLF